MNVFNGATWPAPAQFALKAMNPDENVDHPVPAILFLS